MKNGTSIDPHRDAEPVTKASFALAFCEQALPYAYAQRAIVLWDLLHSPEVFGDESDIDP